jgi:hypothetical protein
MRVLPAILALVLLAAPISGVAVAEDTGLQRAIAQNKMAKWQNHEREFWNKFSADMAKMDRNLPGARGLSERAGSPQRGRSLAKCTTRCPTC